MDTPPCQIRYTVSLREKGVDLNSAAHSGSPPWNHVSLREKGVDLNIQALVYIRVGRVSLREKGVDLNGKEALVCSMGSGSPFVRREWI